MTVGDERVKLLAARYKRWQIVKLALYRMGVSTETQEVSRMSLDVLRSEVARCCVSRYSSECVAILEILAR
jgi:hypothetical protein